MKLNEENQKQNDIEANNKSVVADGKRTRKPKAKEYPDFSEKPEYGHGNKAQILIDTDGTYHYTVLERNGVWGETRRGFSSPEECKKHLKENYGGNWKWHQYK